ncbi:MAG: hypothetical protein U5K31_06725 [Balneolaceae bacterium]|nr:hypothetical protein [Balneolaceae bacterium]
MELLNRMKLHLEDMARIEPEFETYLEELSSARISIQETVSFTERYRSGIEFNPRRLEELRSRLSELNRLRKKYSPYPARVGQLSPGDQKRAQPGGELRP